MTAIPSVLFNPSGSSLVPDVVDLATEKPETTTEKEVNR